MFFYFLLAVCSDIFINSNKVVVPAREKPKDKDFCSVDDIITPRHSSITKENNDTMKIRSYDSLIASNSRFNPYKKIFATSEKAFNYDSTEPLDLSNKKTIENDGFVANHNVKIDQDRKIDKYTCLFKNYEKYIRECDERDTSMQNFLFKLKFEDEDIRLEYNKYRRNTNDWIKKSFFPIFDIVSNLSHAINNLKIDKRSKEILLIQTRYFHSVIEYAYALLPHQEKRKQANSHLLSCYKRVAERFTVLFRQMKLREVYNDLRKLFFECLDVEDPVLSEIKKLMVGLDVYLNIIYNDLDQFIARINRMLMILSTLNKK
ncbi:uncharacterized protein VNE69_03324 [Vairimorpha necatrix]|uniref:Uncharacterized protein n=1 Tax=Vairimorpha necatrix TaxID=6039 RepID=A0AAX4JAY7_9MICR